MRGLGTLINLATVAFGGGIGLFMGDRLPERMRVTIMQGLGLVTLAVGITGLEPLYDADLGLRRFIILIGAIIAGGLLGEALNLEDRLERFGGRIKERFGVKEDPHAHHLPDHSSFVEGFVIASTVFCVGPLTILGAIEDGVGDSIRLLAIKSALDGFAALGFASVYGVGVLLSLGIIFVYQGGVTLAAALVEPLMTTEVIAQLGAIGSLLVLGIALRLLEIKQIRVVNLLPALFLGPLAAGIVEQIVS
ncbi:MAG: DUF554 family protein [Actinobacteria bacterium]|nr:DUF554 family protein [Actinomycetota bacterium]